VDKTELVFLLILNVYNNTVTIQAWLVKKGDITVCSSKNYKSPLCDVKLKDKR